MNKKVFISYSHKNKSFAKKLATSLYDHGISVWWDEWEIKPGDIMVDKINSGIMDSGYFLLILTPDSTSSEWVEIEWTSAFTLACNKKNLRIIPILKETCTIPMVLQNRKYIDFRKSYKTQIQILINNLLDDLKRDASNRLNLEKYWIENYRNGDLKTKLDAIGILFNIGSKLTINYILADVEIQDSKVQDKILNRISGCFDKDFIPHINRLSTSRNSRLAIQASGFLINLGDRKKISEIFKNAKSNDIILKKYALKTISFIENFEVNELKELKNILFESLNDNDDSIKLHALGILSKVSNQFKNKNKVLLIPLLHSLKKLLDNRKPEVRYTASYLYENLIR